MKKLITLILGIALVYGCTSNNSNNSDSNNNSVTSVSDVDGNSYNVIILCNQTWTKSNLNVSKYSDGTPIPQVTNPTQWLNLTTGAWCYYNNDPAIGNTYGKLYNWYAVAGIYNAASQTNITLRKKLAPLGWHIPADSEWTTLINCLGGENVAGGNMKEAGTSHWQSPNTVATNNSAFTALPGGFRYDDNGIFGSQGLLGVGFAGYWWSSSETNIENANILALYYFNGGADLLPDYKAYGFSVRCLKD